MRDSRTGQRHSADSVDLPPRMLVLEVEHDPALDVRSFAPVVAALENLTPRVEVLAPGRCVFATRGPSRYYGGDEALAALVQETVVKTLADAQDCVPADASDEIADVPAEISEISVRVGIADGLFAAGLAARIAPKGVLPKEVLSKGVLSKGVLVVPPCGSAEFLSGLSLRTLAEECSLPTGSATDGSMDDLISLLWQLGFRSLGDLAALPVGDLLGRFGLLGEWVHALASGRDPRLSQPAAAQPEFSVAIEIDPPADRVDTVAFAAKSLADQLGVQLAREGQALVCVEISAETEHGETNSGLWRHGFSFSPADVVDRVRWQLDGWRKAKGRSCLTGRVCGIRLRAVETRPDEGRQLGFWGDQSETDERAERALQRVQTLVGFDGVTVGHLGAGRHIADLEQRLPFGTAGPRGTGVVGTVGPRGTGVVGTVGPRGTGVVGTAGPRGTGASNTALLCPPWPGRLGVPVPAEVAVKPEPLIVLDANGEPVGVSGRAQLSAPPAVLRWADGRSSRITAWAGPWPLDERWWDPSARRRQARLQLVLDDGTAHLCAIEHGRWQREATYD